MHAKRLVVGLAAASVLVSASAFAHKRERYMPFILGHIATGSMTRTVAATRAALMKNGMRVVGQYVPFAGVTIICATDPELLNAAAHARNGGFGAVERIAVTKVGNTLQVSYANPAYTAIAYGLKPLPVTESDLKAALGDQLAFGAHRGLTRSDLKPGNYHYFFGMPYFENVYHIKKYHTYAQAVAVVRKNLEDHLDGTTLVYEVTVPGAPKPTTVFGVGMSKGKSSDAFILHTVDVHKYKGSAYLPYEMMVVGRRIISLRPRYRIAVNFPSTSMMGAHGFMHMIDSPGAIRKVLGLVGGRRH